MPVIMTDRVLAAIPETISDADLPPGVSEKELVRRARLSVTRVAGRDGTRDGQRLSRDELENMSEPYQSIARRTVGALYQVELPAGEDRVTVLDGEGLNKVLGSVLRAYSLEDERRLDLAEPLPVKGAAAALEAMLETIYDEPRHYSTGFGTVVSQSTAKLGETLLVPVEGWTPQDAADVMGGEPISAELLAPYVGYLATMERLGHAHYVTDWGNSSSENGGWLIASVAPDRRSVHFTLLETWTM